MLKVGLFHNAHGVSHVAPHIFDRLAVWVRPESLGGDDLVETGIEFEMRAVIEDQEELATGRTIALLEDDSRDSLTRQLGQVAGLQNQLALF